MKNLFGINFAALLLFTILFFCSCANGLYSPINEVMHSTSSKGELELGINFNHSNASKIQSSLSYSPMKNIGLSYSNVASTALKSNSLAIGVYSNNKTEKEFSKVFYDAYVGACMAKHIDFFNEFQNNAYLEYEIYGNYLKLFTQVGYHTISKNKRFDLVAKVNYVDWTKIIVFGNVNFSQTAESLKKNEPFVFFEVNPKLSFGPDFYKLNLGCNLHLQSNTELQINKFIVYTGISINLNNIFTTGLLAREKK